MASTWASRLSYEKRADLIFGRIARLQRYHAYLFDPSMYSHTKGKCVKHTMTRPLSLLAQSLRHKMTHADNVHSVLDYYNNYYSETLQQITQPCSGSNSMVSIYCNDATLCKKFVNNKLLVKNLS